MHASGSDTVAIIMIYLEDQFDLTELVSIHVENASKVFFRFQCLNSRVRTHGTKQDRNQYYSNCSIVYDG